jgi:hypothetical protein
LRALFLGALALVAPLSAQSLRLESLGRTVLGEAIAADFGRPGGLTVLRDGSYLITDAQVGVLLQVERSGEVLRRVGRRGTGPMEWSTGPSTLHVANDSTLIVGDGGRVVVVALPQWTQRGVIAKPGPLATVAAVDARRVIFSRVNPAREATVAVAEIASGAITDGGPYTAILRGGSAAVAQLMSFSSGGFLRDGRFVFAIQHADLLFVSRDVHGPFDSVAVGGGARRGAQSAVIRAVRDADPATIQAGIYRASEPTMIAEGATAGVVHIVYADRTQVDRRMTSTLFVARTHATRGGRCRDVAVPVPSDPIVMTALRGDTLFALVQRETSGGNVEMAVERYAIKGEGC